MRTAILVLNVLTALGCGLVGGVFFAFSAFVMKALAKLTPPCGIAAMQSINLVVINPLFLGAFLGTGVLCLATTLVAILEPHDARTLCVLAGSALYLIGTLGVTVLCNVPRNDRLAAVAASEPSSEPLWREYASGWTWWNHVRTVAALAAAALFTFAL